MSKRKIIIGNWKMNPVSLKEAEKIFSAIAKSVSKMKRSSLVICPPVLYLSKLKKISKKVALGGQNCFWEEKGAFTGELSAEMLYEAGARYLILGHSERRALGETDVEINKKVRAALSAGLRPILCVGERERDEQHEYLGVVKRQLEECLERVEKSSLAKVVIAYEPVWAIGQSAVRQATAEEFLEMSLFIKKSLSDKFGRPAAEVMQIVYGGSVTPKNALEFLREGEADGLLVGRDSLDPKKFVEIVKICE